MKIHQYAADGGFGFGGGGGRNGVITRCVIDKHGNTHTFILEHVGTAVCSERDHKILTRLAPEGTVIDSGHTVEAFEGQNVAQEQEHQQESKDAFYDPQAEQDKETLGLI